MKRFGEAILWVLSAVVAVNVLVLALGSIAATGYLLVLLGRALLS